MTPGKAGVLLRFLIDFGKGSTKLDHFRLFDKISKSSKLM